MSIPSLILLFRGWRKASNRTVEIFLNQILSIDVEQDAVIIYTSWAKYKCFVSNGINLQQIINEKRKQNNYSYTHTSETEIFV